MRRKVQTTYLQPALNERISGPLIEPMERQNAMELDITHMIEDEDDMIELSGNRIEHGQDAGRITWNNSLAYGREHPLLADDDALETAREYFASYGAWSESEIAAWSSEELNAITCQEIAAQIREGIEQRGQIYKGDDGRWYFYLGD